MFQEQAFLTDQLHAPELGLTVRIVDEIKVAQADHPVSLIWRGIIVSVFPLLK